MSDTQHFQVAIVGGGPGGYVTAIRLNQYGISTVVFERERLGGVCLNWGCIPTKTLVKSADFFAECRHASEFGVGIENPVLDFSAVMARKNKTTDTLVSGVEFLFKKRAIPVIRETVTDICRCEGVYTLTSDTATVTADYVILATGSVAKSLPGIEIDETDILSSTGILSLNTLPSSLAVVGGGVIGCEFASIFSQFGVKSDVVEFLPRIVATEDEEVARRLTMAMKKSGVGIHTGTGVERIEKTASGLVLYLSNGKTLTADKVLMSVGRAPHCGIRFRNCEPVFEKGRIITDHKLETVCNGLFAIGDVTGKMLLAHTASVQGLVVAEHIRARIGGLVCEVREPIYDNIPRCTFTNPEIGSVGLSEEATKNSGIDILVGRGMFVANGKALGLGNTFGFVKTIADKSSGKLIGMHIIGPQATELVAVGANLINAGATVHEALRMVYAHPTLSEVIGESVEDLEGLSIHKV